MFSLCADVVCCTCSSIKRTRDLSSSIHNKDNLYCKFLNCAIYISSIPTISNTTSTYNVY